MLRFGRLPVASPLLSMAAQILLADHAAHFTNGLHTADQVLLDIHNNIPPGWIEKVEIYLSIDVFQQGAVSSDGLLNLFLCGLCHIVEPPNRSERIRI